MKNITSLRLVRLAQGAVQGNGFGLWLVPYMTGRHFSRNEILLLLAICQAVSFPIQYPTGVFADKLSRKLSLTIGAALCLASMCLYAPARTWMPILIASLTGVVGRSFFAGADAALARALYQNMYPYDWKDRFVLFATRVARYQGLVEAGTCGVAALLATVLGIWAVILAQGAAYLVALVLVLAIREPKLLTLEEEEPTRYYVDPSDRMLKILSGFRPGWAFALATARAHPDFPVSTKVAQAISDAGFGGLTPEGSLSFKHTYSDPTPVHPAGLRPAAYRRGALYITQLPPSARSKKYVLKVASPKKEEKALYTVLGPPEFAAQWPTISPRPAIGGPWVPTKGPARQLTDAEHAALVADLARREARRRLWSIVALVIGVGAVTSLTAVTYRVAPLCYGSLRFHGRLMYGWVWILYLVSTLGMGFGYRWLVKLGPGKSLALMSALAVLGGACYTVFGLVGAAWGLSALLGLALVRAQESALNTKFFNELTSTRNHAAAQSALRMMQDGMAGGMILLLNWWTRTHGLGTGLIGIGVIHAMVACTAFGVLAYLYRP